MRSLLVFSALGHFFLMLALMLTPGAPPLRIPPALTVDLVAALPPSPTPSAPVPAAPPKPKVKLLPKQAPPALPKAKPKAKPKPEPAIQRRARPEAIFWKGTAGLSWYQ